MVSLSVSRKARPSALHGIVLLIGDLEGGGAERQCYLLARGLREAHQDVTVVTENASEKMSGEYASINVPVEVIGRTATRQPAGRLARARRYVAGVASAVNRLRPAVLQAFLPRSNCAASLVRRLDGPVVIASHRYAGRATWNYDLGQALEAIVCRRADVNLANSEGVARHLRTVLRLPAGSIRVVPNGAEALTDASCFSDRARVRLQLGLEDEDVALVKVANLWPYKGYQDLVAALAIVPPELRVRAFFVGGDRGFQSELERKVGVSGLSDRIRFLGEREDVCRLLPAFDVYVSASRGEGMSNAVMEAMQHGLAVIGSRVAGTPDLLDGGAAGLLYPPGNVQELARSIVELASDSARRRRLGALARRRVDAEFSDRAMVGRTIQVYADASRRRGRAGLASELEAALGRVHAFVDHVPAAARPS